MGGMLITLNVCEIEFVQNPSSRSTFSSFAELCGEDKILDHFARVILCQNVSICELNELPIQLVEDLCNASRSSYACCSDQYIRAYRVSSTVFKLFSGELSKHFDVE